jgi:hypothetical protein
LSDYADIAAALARIEAKQTKLHADLGKARADVMERIDRLSDVVTAMRDDLAVKYGATDKVRTAHDSRREELRILSDIIRKLTRLKTEVREIRGE